MSVAASPAGVPLPQPRIGREALADGLLTGAIALLILALGPAPGDAPAHLYRTLLVRDGAFLWDNFWYAGQYPLASYSLLYYLPAAVVGNLPLVLVSAVVSTALFAAIAFREWGATARWPCRIFGILAAAPAFTGLYAYSVGFAALLAALRALQARRVVVGIVLAGLTLGFSPLAFVFLVLILVAVLTARRRLTRRALAVAVCLGALTALELVILHLFPSPGIYPFHWIDLGSLFGVSTLGALLATRSKEGAPLAAFFVLWAVGSLAFFLVPSPLGDNWTRLRAFVFALMLLAALLSRFRPWWLAAAALAAALAYNLTPYMMLIPYRLDGRPAAAAFWAPALRFLKRHGDPNYRVEVVPTASHWEAYWFPRAGVSLARGWYRQLDVVDNPVLYRKHLDAAEYTAWLLRTNVEYVVVPRTRLDPIGGPREASLLRTGLAGVRLVYRGRNWTIYRLLRPSPLVTGPAPAHITAVGHAEITGWVAAAGRYRVAVHYSPYWQLASGEGCLAEAPDEMTWLRLDRAGLFRMTVPQSPEEIFESALTGRVASC